MGLELSQIYSLLRNRDGTVQFEHMPVEAASHLGSELRIVYLSARSLRHIFESHPKLEGFDLLILPRMIRDGLWIADKPHEACVFYRHPESAKLFKAAIKVAGAGYEAYVSSFYRCSDRHIKAAMQRGTILAGRMDGGRLG